MRNPPPTLFAQWYKTAVAVPANRYTQRAVKATLGLLLGLTVGLLTWSAQAQNLETFEWQLNAFAQPAALSTPHHEVEKLLRQAKYAQALPRIEQALQTNPRDPQMRFWQGFIFEKMGQAEMALQVYLALTQDYPELAEPHNNLGVLYAAQGDYAKAKTALDAALYANPSDATAHANLGDLLLHMSHQSYARAAALSPERREFAKKIEQLKPLLQTPHNR